MRLIDADALIDALHGSIFYADAIPFVEDAPTVEAVPVIHGEWIYQDDYIEVYYQCNKCGKMFVFEGTPQENNFNFCPNCGADMRKKG